MKRNFLLLLILFSLAAMGQKTDWLTFYEKSGFLETPRYAETMDFCNRLGAVSDWVTVTSFGISPQGRALPLIIVDKDGMTDPQMMKKAGKLILMVQCCIHAGECEGKDAMLMLIRDMVIKNYNTEFLEKISIIFIPIFNVDGHERFGPYNRINQNGPKEMGWRTTADNLNLNRDYLKADAPEIQAWLRMFNKWMPDFFIDTHSTNGADYQYVLTYMVEIYGNMDQGLTDWLKDSYVPALTRSLDEKQILSCPYVSFRSWTDLSSGIIYYPSPPMLSQGYAALRNRPGLLIETHMLKPYKQRVSATYECLVSNLVYLSTEAETVKSLVSAADKHSSSADFRAVEFPAQFRTSETDSVMINFLGNRYELLKSEITGDTYYKYSDKPDNFLLPCFSRNIPSVLLKLPEAYIVPAEWETVIERLSLHGIRMFKTPGEITVSVQTYQFVNPKWQMTPYEARHPLSNIEYQEITEKRSFAAGSAIVPMDQPASRVIAQMLEPKGQGSLLYWGFFDAIFEQKEYVEEYVIEPMIIQMLADNPELKKEFEEKKSKEPLFAKSPQMISNWFFMKTPYFDKRKNIYPIGKITDDKLLKSLFEQTKSD